jgi:hypothetical protein
MRRCAESWPPRRRRAFFALLLFCLAAPLVAETPEEKRQRLEREIEERQTALDRLAEEPAEVEQAPRIEVEQDVASELPRSSRADHEDVTLGSSRTVRGGESAPGMVVVGGHFKIEKHGVVEGDVTVVGGSAEVDGELKGTLVVVGGSANLGDGAAVEGDVISIGGPIRDHGQVNIEGQRVQVAFGDLGGLGTYFEGHGMPHWDDPLGFSILDLMGTFFRSGLLILVVMAVVLLAPGRTASIAEVVRAQPWRSGLIGLIAEVIFLPVLVVVVAILAISIIGIPLVLVVPPLLVLGLIVFFLIGYAGVARAAGGVFERRFDRRYTSYALVLLGILLIEGWSLAGEVLLYLPGPIQIMAVLALAFGFFVQYLAWTVGLGAAISDQVERRRLQRQALAESRFVDNLDAQ